MVDLLGAFLPYMVLDARGKIFVATSIVVRIEVGGRLNEICGIPPFRDEAAQGWGTQAWSLRNRWATCPGNVNMILTSFL